ncbi:MAG TPA: glycosyltransferase family 9 protein [Acetobacteraceae bacterium]|nr:glycosyltransferase family 9 protein [Acetobacteraceae bacterium]
MDLIDDPADGMAAPSGRPHGPDQREPRLAVEARVQVGRVDGRLDLIIRGHLQAPVAVEGITLLADGVAVSRISGGRADARNDAGGGQGFDLVLSRVRAFSPARTEVELAARLADGRTHREALTLRVDAEAGEASIEPSRAVSPTGTARPPPAICLYVERASLSPSGRLSVSGWAVASNALVTVQLFAGEHRIGAARVGLSRPDVGRVHPRYQQAALSGFAFDAPVPPEVLAGGTLTVQALALDGVFQETVMPVERHPIDPAPPAPPGSEVPTSGAHPIHLHCDEAGLSLEGDLAVTGWVVCAAGISAVAVFLDGEALGEAELGLRREDVASGFPAIPFARLSGFHFAKAGLAPREGARTLRLVARNGLGESTERTQPIHPAPVAPRAAAPDPSPAPQDFRVELDSPAVSGGVATAPVSGRLTIGGWAVARGGVEAVTVLIDGQPAGAAHYGAARQDVAAALPDWPGALRSGFIFNCPPRLLKEGPHEATIRVAAPDGREHATRFAFTVHIPPDAEARFGIRRRLPRAELDLDLDLLARLAWRPAFRLLTPLRVPEDVAAAADTIEALRRQPYGDWRVLLLAGSARIGRAAAALARDDERVVVLGRDAMDRVLGGAADDTLFALLGPGDLPGVDALIEMAVASGLDRAADFFTCDESRVSPARGEREPFYKPRFSPELLLSTNYVGRFCCARASLLAAIGATPRGLLRDGEYDFVLRCTEAARAVRHVPLLLLQRGAAEEGAASERAALAAAARRRGIPGEIAAGRTPRSYRLRRTEPVPGLVSVIIPTCGANGHVRICVETLRASTAPGRIEIICIENIPEADAHWRDWLHAHADRVIHAEDGFNWSRFNNRCAREARGEFLLFLNDDIEVMQPDWLDAMLEQAARPEIGVVGPRLLYPDGRVQHAGMFLAQFGIARHAFRFAEASEPGYFGLALTTRNVIAVTGACLMVRRALFESLGGFDEAHEIVNNDLDFCLRAHGAGHAVVYTPHATLIHHEMASRGAMPDSFDTGRFRQRWTRLFAEGDPFFSPNLARGTDDFVPEEEPAQLVCSGHPLFSRDEISRVLAMKLDHIGDFFTAVPALRRLRALFPEARITLLGSPGLRGFAVATGAVDDFIGFEFFHARSGLGQKALEESELGALAARLAPERFDLAIDLRKHLDTREILRRTGARHLAGFDHLGQFPWLDVALEWEGDRGMHPKRSHVGDDLLNLVEAIGTASGADRTVLPPAAPGTLDFLPPDARGWFDRPVVCVHPGVGNVMRQWPAAHFARLIDRLVEDHGVRVVLIGGGDEAALGNEVLAGVMSPGAVLSLIGRVKLADLPALLAACALFVGNNSGPKHIAAALGVPTVGIHSGVVDATEWAPLGPRAVAVRRVMACSPCYLARPQDCHRELACLAGLEPATVYSVCARLLAASPPPC